MLTEFASRNQHVFKYGLRERIDLTKAIEELGPIKLKIGVNFVMVKS